MFQAARFTLLVTTLAWMTIFGASPAEAAPRAVPTRPGRSASKPGAPLAFSHRMSGPESVSVTEAASRLGLKLVWVESARKVVLSDRSHRVELEAGSREIEANGLRVFLGQPITAHGGTLFINRIDFETCLVPLLRPALIGSPPPVPKVVALDPGHGGNDNGTENHRLGLQEKTFTLDVALRLKALLETRGYRVVLTRQTDTRVELPMRPIVANRAGADLFVSIHFNALPSDAKTRGTEVFTFAPQFQRSTDSWSHTGADDSQPDAERGNRFDAWNSALAHALHRELIGRLKTFDRGKKIAHFGVLRGLDCPGVLVESGFLSNGEEAKKIATTAYRQQIALAMADGISDYAALIASLRGK